MNTKKITFILLRRLVGILFRVRIHGLENIPTDKKLLIVANHASFLDGLLLALFLPIDATFVIHRSVLQNRLIRKILSLSHFLPMDAQAPMSVKTIVGLIMRGNPVVIFPEGRITQTGALMKVYNGAGYIAAKTQATILPVHIEGTKLSLFSKMEGQSPKKLFPKVTLTCLKPTSIEMPSHQKSDERRQRCGDSMRKILQNMVFETAASHTLFESLLNAIHTFGRKKTILEDSESLEVTYHNLLKQSLAIGRLSTKISLLGENIGVLLPNTPLTVATVYGLSSTGRVPAMLNYSAGREAILNACQAAHIKTILTSRQFVQKAALEEILHLPDDIAVIFLEDLKPRFNFLDQCWLYGFALWFPQLAAPTINPKSPAVILFTSGTESKPKGVVHSHESILANVAQIHAVVDFTANDKFMVCLPMFHAFGFTCGAIAPIISGAMALIYPSPLHYRIIPEVIYDRGCTVLFSTSTFLAQYAKYAHPYDFFKLRYVVSGAEKLDPALKELYFDKFGIRIYEGYGATECAPVLAVNTPMAYRSSSVGQLLPGIEYQLKVIPDLANGQLLKVRGKNIMMGYYLYDQPGRIISPTDGWYLTGDIVEMDMDGYIYILGRQSRFAKIAGEMISLEVVERIAYQISPLSRHAALSQLDKKRGEIIILLTEDALLSRTKLVMQAKKMGVSELNVPKKIQFIDEIPTLVTGKTDYHKIEQHMKNSRTYLNI
jgi:acyl-[acyl-carrier-protein]-phospholipid O-acyltransferase / long-chain-fatty-acid--[acyl-carrier-protein] ligase